MWIIWMFVVIIPIGVIHAILSGELSIGSRRTGGGILRFDENPVGFVIMVVALCVLEAVLLAALTGIRAEDKSHKRKRKRRRAHRAS